MRVEEGGKRREKANVGKSAVELEKEVNIREDKLGKEEQNSVSARYTKNTLTKESPLSLLVVDFLDCLLLCLYYNYNLWQ